MCGCPWVPLPSVCSTEHTPPHDRAAAPVLGVPPTGGTESLLPPPPPLEAEVLCVYTRHLELGLMGAASCWAHVIWGGGEQGQKSGGEQGDGACVSIC